MAARNPAISTAIVGCVQLRYKDPDETLVYSVDVSGLLSETEEVDPSTLVVSVSPDDGEIDHSYMADANNVTVYVDTGGVIHTTYEFAIKFDSTLGNPYADYMRCCVKRVYKECC